MKDGQNKNNSVQHNNIKIRRIVLFFVVYMIAYILLISTVTPKQYNLKEGDIPRVDIKATRDIVDEKSTLEKENQAIEKVGKQYTLRGEVKSEAENNIKILFDKLNESVSLVGEKNDEEDSNDKESDNLKTQYEKIAELKKVINVTLTQNEYKALLDIPKENLDSLQKNILNIINTAYEKNLEENDEESLKEARENATKDVKVLGLSEELSNAFSAIVSNEINPNFFYDVDKTEEKIKEAQKNVSKVIIKQNQIIVKEGEPVTAEQLQLLSDLGMLDDENDKVYSYVYLSRSIFSYNNVFTIYIYKI